MGKEQIDESAVLTELDALAGLLDRILAFFGPNVLRGPAGARLAQGMHERRQELVSMMSTVAQDVARANKSGFVYHPCVRRVPSLPSDTRWVQIAPEAAERLQREMGSDADRFVGHSRRISRMFTAGGRDAPNMLACERTAGWCHEQERDLRRRIEYARAAEHAPFGLDGGAPAVMYHQRGMVLIPDWTEFGPEQRSKMAQMQARRVGAAFGAPNAKSRQDLAAVAAWLRANQNDPAVLAEFWKHTGTQRAATLASLLNRQDRDAGMDATQVFSDQSKQIMTAFATSLATATRPQQMYGQPGGGAETASPLPEFREGFATSAKSDMWSTSMLFKYGPKGDQWDPGLLSTMSRAVMEWRKSSQGQVPIVKPVSTSMGGMVQTSFAHNAWYARLGITPMADAKAPMPGVGKESAFKLSAHNHAAQLAMRDYDPAAAILARSADHPDVPRSLLQDPKFVQEVLSIQWLVPAFTYDGNDKYGPKGDVDASAAAGRLIAAGVRGDLGSSDQARQAAQAMVNILASNYEWSTKSPNKSLPSGLQEGLRSAVKAHIPALANSTDAPADPKNPASDNENQVTHDEPYAVQSNSVLVQTLLLSAFSDQKQLADLRGEVQAYVINSIRLSGSSETDELAVKYGVRLLAMVDGLNNRMAVGDAKTKDIAETEQQARLGRVLDGVGLVPVGPGKVASKAGETVKTIADLGKMFMDAVEKTPNNEAKARYLALQTSASNKDKLRALVIQGMINRASLVPPKDAPWLKSGHVVPGAALNTWWQREAGDYRNPDGARVKMPDGSSLIDYEKGMADAYQGAPPPPPPH